MEHESEWEIKIESQEDAKRFARLGGYAGFIHTVGSTLLAVLIMYMMIKQMGEKTELEVDAVKKMSVGLVFIGIRFVIYWILSWRTFTGRGIISAPVLLLLFVVETAAIVFGIIASKMIFFLLIIVIPLAFGFVMLAGVKGNWANRRYRKQAALG